MTWSSKEICITTTKVVYFTVYKYLKIFPFIFYTFTIESDTKNLITSTVILRVSYLLKVKVIKANLQAKDGHFS
jgi:hypothetical protein